MYCTTHHVVSRTVKLLPKFILQATSSIRRFDYSTSNKNNDDLHHNDLVDSFNENEKQNMDLRKQLRGDGTVKRRVSVSDYGIDSNIRQTLLSIQNTSKIIKYIERNAKNIQSAQTYGIAMTKCKKTKDWESVRSIMDLLLSNSNVAPNIIQFTQCIDCMALCDKPHVCIEYYKTMINKHGIKPNVITFATLIKSFRRQGLHELADVYFQSMINQWNIEPSESVYCEMMCVYAISHQIQKANDLFNKYKSNVGEMNDLPILGAYLDVFCKSGDLNGMETVITLIKNSGYQLNIVIITSIITAYQRKRQYQKSLDVLQEWVKNEMNKPNLILLYRKCVALSTLVADSTKSYHKRKQLFKQLQNTIYHETNQLSLKPDTRYFCLELEAAIFLYKDKNPMEIVKVFESLLERKLIGYQGISKENIVVELHHFQKWHAQFILRYLFGLKINEAMKMLTRNKLFIVVGKGKHAKGKAKQTFQMKQFVIDELKSWDPPIHCTEHEINHGVIWIDKNELEPYLKDNNYAKQKLSSGSKDWFEIEV